MSYFDATKELDAAIGEIDHLLAAAKIESKSPVKYKSLVNMKAALVLLASKLEAYVENIVEEYIDAISSYTPKSKHLPVRLKDHSTEYLLGALTRNCHFSEKPKNKNLLMDASRLWVDEEPLATLKINGKFSYGKHGSVELEELFNRIGIDNLYQRCLVSGGGSESMVATTGMVSIEADINSLTNIRNNIIHNDATPNFTIGDLENYKNRIWEFCYQIDRTLNEELILIASRISSNP